MAGDAIRNLYIGLQSTRDVAATTSMIAVPLDDIAHKPNRQRKATNEYFGTLAQARRTLRGTEYDSMTLKSLLYYDWMPNVLASLLKMPVTANHSGETTVKDHTMVEAINAPLLTVQFDDGVQWWQMLNVVCSQGKFTAPEGNQPEVEFTLMGDPATIISAPTPIALALASYAGPIDWPQLLVSVGSGQVVDMVVTAGGSAYTSPPTVVFTGGGFTTTATAVATLTGGVVTGITITGMGAGYTSAPTITFTGGGGTLAAATAYIGGAADIMSGSVTINRNRKARFPARRKVAPKRFVEGSTKVDFEVNPDYASDTASLFKLFRQNGNSQMFPAIQFEWANTNINLGVVPTNPTFRISGFNPLVITGDHDVTKMPAETPIKGEFGYDATTGGAVQVVVTNSVTAYAAS